MRELQRWNVGANPKGYEGCSTMRELQIVAVGSSELIAKEIKEITASFLGNGLPIRVATVRSVRAAEPDSFYVCATTQQDALEKVIPSDRLFVFDLHPTTMFFLAIAKIPAGEHVFVFNNLIPYTELLARECLELGIEGLRFHPVAYDEMDEEEVRRRLTRARYIIGVDCMVNENVLLSEKYRRYLREDVIIIPGKRAASVASANRLLGGITNFYVEGFLEKSRRLFRESKAGKSDITKLSCEIDALFTLLRHASLQTVTSQINGNPRPGFSDFDGRRSRPVPGEYDEDFIKGQIDALCCLQKKLEQLGS